MSSKLNARPVDPYTAYLAAYQRLHDAQGELVDATRRAFPVGAQVRSEVRHQVFVHGTVSAICDGHDYGCIIVRNNKTEKMHRAYPMMKGAVQRTGTDW